MRTRWLQRYASSWIPPAMRPPCVLGPVDVVRTCTYDVFEQSFATNPWIIQGSLKYPFWEMKQLMQMYGIFGVVFPLSDAWFGLVIQCRLQQWSHIFDRYFLISIHLMDLFWPWSSTISRCFLFLKTCVTSGFSFKSTPSDEKQQNFILRTSIWVLDTLTFMSSFTLPETDSEFTPAFLDGLEDDIVSFLFGVRWPFISGKRLLLVLGNLVFFWSPLGCFRKLGSIWLGSMAYFTCL